MHLGMVGINDNCSYIIVDYMDDILYCYTNEQYWQRIHQHITNIKSKMSLNEIICQYRKIDSETLKCFNWLWFILISILIYFTVMEIIFTFIFILCWCWACWYNGFNNGIGKSSFYSKKIHNNKNYICTNYNVNFVHRISLVFWMEYT